MPCLTSKDGSLTVCTPTVTHIKKRILFCPKCRLRRKVTVNFYAWYGSSARCTAPRRRWKYTVKPCGYSWRWD